MTPDELQASFQPAGLAHLASIIQLRRRFIGKSPNRDDERYLRWRYDLEGRSEDKGRLMIVVRADRVLGMIGTEKLRLAHGKETLDALSLMDILVDPELDGVGLGVWLSMAIFTNTPVAVAIGSNQNSIGLINRLFHRLPNRTQYAAPLTIGHYLSKRLQSKLAMSALAIPTDFALKLWRAVTFRRIPPSWSLRDLARFDDSVESLFERRWGFSEETVVRSSQYLNWRLFEAPDVKYSVIAAFEAGDMIAYIAYYIEDGRRETKTMRLIDWLVDARYGFDGFSLLVQELMRRALRERVDVVSMTFLHERLERSLWRLGFASRPGSEFATVGIRCAEPARFTDLLDGSCWNLTDANTDFDCP
ncbi:hypothetical protein [Thiocapsa marina]|nr:hypothetical protein [Thiocapsa marina]